MSYAVTLQSKMLYGMSCWLYGMLGYVGYNTGWSGICECNMTPKIGATSLMPLQTVL